MVGRMDDFFTQLTEFSRRVFAQLHLPLMGSPWGGDRISGPKGAIIHFTADSDMRHVLDWFCRPEAGSRDSSHVVVGDQRYDWADGFDYDLPLIKALPATVVQTRPLPQIAWHATWTNQSCFGVECVNVGELRKAGSDFCWWPARAQGQAAWTARWPGEKTPAALYGRYWEPFTTPQVCAVAAVLRAVHATTPLLRPWIVGHENVQGTETPGSGAHDKRDAGPAFPLHALRDAVTGGDDAPIALALADPNYAVAHRLQATSIAMQAMGRSGTHEALLALLPTLDRVPRVLFKSLLYQMGYLINDLTREVFDMEETASVYLFQRLMGLATDGVPGPNTTEAAVQRYLNRYGSSNA